MPRKHIHVPGTALRRNYNLNNIELALNSVFDEHLSFSQAAEKFGVPKTTIYRRYRGMNSDKLGRPTVLNLNEEDKIVEALMKAAEFGYPFTSVQLRQFIQSYLNQKGVVVNFFKDNLPGIEWYNNFIGRHPELSVRNSENIKRSRAYLSKETMQTYFNNLKVSIEGILPENIVNFDETNLSDDPGKEKVIVRRGSKHSSKIMDTSKSSTSLMFACAGNGCMLPLYIVYKAKNLYPDWIEGGPRGTVYNRSNSGWFDSFIFEDWFLKVALPYLKRKEGKKMLIGDNLASHMSIKIIRLCEENDINFVFLPANSTHVCQPLDVAVFRPVKMMWKKILIEWKQKNRGVIQKSKFPSLITDLMDKLEGSVERNIKAGFEACGIIPFNPDRVIKKLFPTTDINENALNNSFTKVLQETFQKNVPVNGNQRKRKITVQPGQSVTSNDLQGNAEEEEEPSREASIQGDENQPILIDQPIQPTHSQPAERVQWNQLDEGLFVLVSFIYNQHTRKEMKKNFVCKIVSMDPVTEHIKVSCMRQYQKLNHCFVFPTIEDINIVSLKDIVKLLGSPSISRGRFSFKDID